MPTPQRALRITFAATALALAPLSVPPGGGVRESAAHAQCGSCCAEVGSVCVYGDIWMDNAFYMPEGGCRPPGGDEGQE